MRSPDDLPYLTREPGIGGTVKREPEDFVVTEVMDVDDEDSQEKNCHYWLSIRRRNMTTSEVIDVLAEALEQDPADIGRSGLKDKRAVATQWFSVSNFSRYAERYLTMEEVRERIPLEILGDIRRRQWKLKLGTHRGNHFDILLSGAQGDVEGIAEEIRQRGFPNYFGPQRFGSGIDMAIRGGKLFAEIKAARIRGDVKSARRLKHKARTVPFLCLASDAFSSMLFNLWLARRLEEESSDIALDEVGSCFGSKTPRKNVPLTPLETQLLTDAGILGHREAFVGVGDLRAAIVVPEDLTIRPDPDGLRFSFVLPKGAYATMLLREFAKSSDFCYASRKGSKLSRSSQDDEVPDGGDDFDDAPTTTEPESTEKKPKTIPRRTSGQLLNHGKRGRAFFAACPPDAAYGRRRERKLLSLYTRLHAAERQGTDPDPDCITHPLMHRRRYRADILAFFVHGPGQTWRPALRLM